jgi:hypothetical protein
MTSKGWQKRVVTEAEVTRLRILECNKERFQYSFYIRNNNMPLRYLEDVEPTPLAFTTKQRRKIIKDATKIDESLSADSDSWWFGNAKEEAFWVAATEQIECFGFLLWSILHIFLTAQTVTLKPVSTTWSKSIEPRIYLPRVRHPQVNTCAPNV